MNVQRRAIFPLLLATTALSGCAWLQGVFSNTGTGITLDQAKSYAQAGAQAFIAAGDAYLAQLNAVQKDVVKQIVDDLTQVEASIGAINAADTLRGSVTEILSFMQRLSPIVSPFLGPAAPYVPIVLAVLQAFVAAAPAPPDAPPTPPAAVVAAGARYRASAKFHRLHNEQ